MKRHKNLVRDIVDQKDTMRAYFNIREDQLSIKNDERKEITELILAVNLMKTASYGLHQSAKIVDATFESAKECVPDNMIVGLAGGGDLFSTIKCATESTSNAVSFGLDMVGDGVDLAADVVESSKEDVGLQASLKSYVQDIRLELFDMKGQLDHLVREEPVLRVEIEAKGEALAQANRKWLAALAEGQRILAQLIRFRKNGAAAVQEHRYQDMAFRIFRNDALQKYRAAFDMAARYTYLAATAYDYDTNLLGSDSQAGVEFLTDIVKKRSIGQILDGEPVPGSPGLADPLGRLEQNFAVLKGQMGFNNPQIESNRFSLRNELLRIDDGVEADDSWRTALQEYRVDDLWQVPEFRRYVRPFAPESLGPQPGLVIPFSTTVTFSLNYFGWPLGPGDSAYDPTHFATRIRGVGVWFADYAGLALSNTPRVYLVPVGADVLRSPSAFDFSTREWQVVDQVLPVPFPIGEQELEEETWTPLGDMLSGPFNEIRRFSSFRAYHYSEPFTDAEIISDSRLIGRSVWNTRWLLIVPGGALLYDPDQGLDTFIDGVTDIKLIFQTYAYSGN